MAKDPSEWLTQADYDLETAQILLDKQRNFYAVFMAHLSLEKALKGLFWKKLNEIPPKTHDLNYLIRKIGIQPDIDTVEFLTSLTEANRLTEFPEDYEKLNSMFSNEICIEILRKSSVVLHLTKDEFNQY